jgi:hypothetical protein
VLRAFLGITWFHTTVVTALHTGCLSTSLKSLPRETTPWTGPRPSSRRTNPFIHTLDLPTKTTRYVNVRQNLLNSFCYVTILSHLVYIYIYSSSSSSSSSLRLRIFSHRLANCPQLIMPIMSNSTFLLNKY